MWSRRISGIGNFDSGNFFSSFPPAPYQCIHLYKSLHWYFFPRFFDGRCECLTSRRCWCNLFKGRKTLWTGCWRSRWKSRASSEAGSKISLHFCIYFIYFIFFLVAIFGSTFAFHSFRQIHSSPSFARPAFFFFFLNIFRQVVKFLFLQREIAPSKINTNGHGGKIEEVTDE